MPTAKEIKIFESIFSAVNATISYTHGITYLANADRVSSYPQITSLAVLRIKNCFDSGSIMLRAAFRPIRLLDDDLKMIFELKKFFFDFIQIRSSTYKNSFCPEM